MLPNLEGHLENEDGKNTALNNVIIHGTYPIVYIILPARHLGKHHIFFGLGLVSVHWKRLRYGQHLM